MYAEDGAIVDLTSCGQATISAANRSLQLTASISQVKTSACPLPPRLRNDVNLRYSA